MFGVVARQSRGASGSLFPLRRIVGCYAPLISIAWLVVCLSGCSGGSAENQDAGDSDGTRDATRSYDAAVDANRDSTVAVDAAGDARSDGTTGLDAEPGETLFEEASGDTTVADSGTTCLSSDAGLSGAAVPLGTTATASGSYSTNTPAGVIDGTGWNAGAYTGWIDLTFPAPLALSGIGLLASAAPTATETYTITGFHGGTGVPLGSWTNTVEGSCNCTVVLPPMLVPEGEYDAIRIDVQGGDSWVSINEISLFTSSCPPSDSQSDATAPEAGVEDAGEASASDANGDGGLPSCLRAGTYAIPTTQTLCDCESTPITSTSTGTTQIQIIDDPTAGWEVEYLQGGIPPLVGPFPIVLTASTFTAAGSGPGCLVVGQGNLTLTVDCQTGTTTLSGDCAAGFPNDCTAECVTPQAFAIAEYETFAGSCTNCIGSGADN